MLLQEERRQGIEFARLLSNDDATQFSRGDSRHSRQNAGRGWKRRGRRASGVVSDGLAAHCAVIRFSNGAC